MLVCGDIWQVISSNHLNFINWSLRTIVMANEFDPLIIVPFQHYMYIQCLNYWYVTVNTRINNIMAIQMTSYTVNNEVYHQLELILSIR